MPVVKGGVWTNIEDEILKAAISKYGLNQWARVSSLLARKTAKQCKARWVEWLDPSIRKVEWSREEDEKLLHLAKVMPTQWRTIAPMVGRTANQCLERYQKLLDDAEAKENAELGLTGPDGETRAPTADDVRRLRPGELDPDPETKPARPDTIDLDEDEKEMLSEARARLANTQGKKAKRKARERQQEESRRLATLQKRRELKAAGINIKVITRKPGQMDYNADIPFEKKPVPGFFDTADEQARNEFQRANFDPRKLQLASKRKGEGDDDTDRKRRKNDDAPSASQQAALKAGQMQRIREAEQSSKRRALALPEPQVSEGELEEIVKMGRMGEEAGRLAREGQNDATRGLVSSYQGLNTNTPIRTPMAPPEQDRIANEIRNIRAMTEAQSALLGGEEPEMDETRATTGYQGIAPTKHVISTPNPLATPLRRGANGPGGPLLPGQTPMRTPRDSYALNSDDGLTSVASTPRDARLADLTMRNRVKAGLASLPKPKNVEFELMIPDEKEEATMTEAELEEDAAERDRREKQFREAQAELERRRQTQVIQRKLPRPDTINLPSLLALAEQLPTVEEAMVAKEAVNLMANDARKFPLPDSQVIGVGAPKEDIDDDAIAEAKLLVLMEAKQMPDSDARQDILDSQDRNSILLDTFGSRKRSLVLLGLPSYGSKDDDESKAEAFEETFETVRESIMAAAEHDVKLEKKLAKHMGGYDKRAKMLRGKISEAHEALRKATVALNGFKALAGSEEVAVQRRLEALRDEVGFVSRREREAQEEYRRAKEELNSLLADGVNGVH